VVHGSAWARPSWPPCLPVGVLARSSVVVLPAAACLLVGVLLAERAAAQQADSEDAERPGYP
jgi:hypothetical protein